MMNSLRHSALLLSLLAAVGGGCGVEPEDSALAQAELIIPIPNVEVTLKNIALLPTLAGYQAKATFDIKNIGTGTASGVSLTKTMVTKSILSGTETTTSTSESVGSLAPGATITREIECPGTPTSYTLCSLAKLRATSSSFDPNLQNNVAYWSSWTCPGAGTVDCQPGPFVPDICSGDYHAWIVENCPDVGFIW